jgi:hypothetical protein
MVSGDADLDVVALGSYGLLSCLASASTFDEHDPAADGAPLLLMRHKDKTRFRELDLFR